MNILTTAEVEGKVLNVGDSWVISNNNSIILQELFEIDGQIYMSTSFSNEPMRSIEIDNNTSTTYLVVKILHEFKKESVIVDELNKNSIKFRNGIYVEKKEETTT